MPFAQQAMILRIPIYGKFRRLLHGKDSTLLTCESFLEKIKSDSMSLVLKNIALTYAYSVVEDTDPFTRFDREVNHRATFAYNYAMQPKSIKPFAKVIKAKTKYLDLIKKFNFNPLPTQLGFTTTMDRKFGELAILQLPTDEFVVPSSFNKFFTWSRNYVFPVQSL